MKMILVSLSFALLLGACRHSSPYEQYQAQLAAVKNTTTRTDSIFLGISLGMPQKEFFAHCWNLNKKGILTDGNSNTAILLRLHNGELKHQASMTFYPEFSNNRICRMSVNVRYDGWAPWNADLQSGHLREDVLTLMKQWYPSGNPFIQLNDPQRGTIYVKVDNNRRITIGSYDDMNVKVDYTDLRAEVHLLK